MRLAVLGNAGSGKSTLSATLSQRTGITHVEVDRFLWQEGWAPASESDYDTVHAAVIAQGEWIVDGMGRWKSLSDRLARATRIVLLDLPYPVLEARIRQRQAAWQAGTLELRPGGQTTPPETEKLLEFVRGIDREWMPAVRQMVADAATRVPVDHLETADQIAHYLETLGDKP